MYGTRRFGLLLQRSICIKGNNNNNKMKKEKNRPKEENSKGNMVNTGADPGGVLGVLLVDPQT